MLNAKPSHAGYTQIEIIMNEGVQSYIFVFRPSNCKTNLLPELYHFTYLLILVLHARHLYLELAGRGKQIILMLIEHPSFGNY